MTASGVHRPGYQRRDHEVIDYEEYQHAPTGLWFRGPPPEPDTGTAGAVTFFGAAQTFGCFAPRPFPQLVGEQLDRPTRNFGYGGAGPRFFLDHTALVDEANAGAAAVVQVMSARSEDNSMFRSGGLEFLERRSDGARVGANVAYSGLVGGFDPVTGRPKARVARAVRRRVQRPRVRRIVGETRENWTASMSQLLRALTVPTVLLWFSTRTPAYQLGYGSARQLFGEFPQLVDAGMLARVAPDADTTATVVSRAGLPQPLISRFDGRPCTVDPGDDRPDLGGRRWTHNEYYPSPEMHEEAARAVVAALGEILR